MKFVLFVEGDTERKALPAFLKRWLDRKLADPVGIKVVKFEGWSELVRDTPTKLCLYLGKSDVIAVIALLDLYGPTIYPSDKITATDRYDWAKRELEAKVKNHPRFRQFFAVHETEAWLLSDPQVFPTEVGQGLVAKSRYPETVNFNEPPSKLLQRLYYDRTRRNYKKVTHGQELFGKLDPEIAYSKCPHLKELLDEMLALASGQVGAAQ